MGNSTDTSKKLGNAQLSRSDEQVIAEHAADAAHTAALLTAYPDPSALCAFKWCIKDHTPESVRDSAGLLHEGETVTVPGFGDFAIVAVTHTRDGDEAPRILHDDETTLTPDEALDSLALLVRTLGDMRAAATLLSPPPACPPWCVDEPGHEYDSRDPKTGACVRQHRSGDFGFIDLCADETNIDGVVTVGPLYFVAEPLTGLAVEQVREFSTDLANALRRWGQINAES
jgi:hypothetical protein